MKYIFFCFCIILLTSCKNSKKTQCKFATCELGYYSNGNRKKEVSYTKGGDTLNQIDYYTNGKISRDSYLISKENSKSHGYVADFYENGKIEDSIYVHIDSINYCIHYDSIFNKIDSRLYTFNGKVVGNALDYYKTGKIKRYAFNSKFGNCIYAREYDSTGKISYEGGKPIAIGITSDTLKIGEYFKIHINIGQLPKWQVHLSVIDISDDKNDLIKSISGLDELSDEVFSRGIYIKHVVTKKGKYKWLIKLDIVDEFNNNINANEEIDFSVI